MNKKLSIELFGDLDFEGMVINITCDRETIASINYEKGIDNMEIEISPKSERLAFSLDDFLFVLGKAKKLAIKCAKEDEKDKR
jgi:hypothetical protein